MASKPTTELYLQQRLNYKHNQAVTRLVVLYAVIHGYQADTVASVDTVSVGLLALTNVSFIY